ncbi:hypothetical protein O1W68_04580 [Rhodococcus sp. H36-A4]|uniref:DUF7010 family protein n=1 Tax=Rhodococcus sp. H36-A4 TaxID=3004353 RepID=UPI0022AF4B0F|nr:hypothetical protein [Rhodococcus sp. H36-A4]MCZ4077209.1 hypothetical protein [Rhodococcus sp. H36-A4]
MSIDEYRQILAESTRYGWGFLAAYGFTWLICAVVWRLWSARVGAYCTLFQGMVALPLAFLLTALTPGPTTPTMPGMDNVSVVLALGQLLGLPIVIALVTRHQFTQVPSAMALMVVVHFAPYSWLYATPLYFIVGAAISIAAATIHTTAPRAPAATPDRAAAGAGRVCLSTGVIMLISASIAWSI